MFLALRSCCRKKSLRHSRLLSMNSAQMLPNMVHSPMRQAELPSAGATLKKPEIFVVWREMDGPEVLPPTRKGFGSRLVERLLAAELNGKSTIAYDPSGVICEIEATITSLP